MRDGRRLRALADEHDLRIIGIDRAGHRASTPHVYDDVLDWTSDLGGLLGESSGAASPQEG